MRSLCCTVLLALLLSASPALGFSTKGEDCAKCHTLKKEDAAALLKDLAPDIKVLEVRVLPVKSLWEVDVESRGKKFPLYVDFSKRFVLQGTLIDIKTKKNLTRERDVDLNRVDVSKIPLKDSLVMGDKNARHKVIVFDDPD